MSDDLPAEPLFPAFLKLAGRKVVLVGGGRVAAGKLAGLLGAGAEVTIVAPEILPEVRALAPAAIAERPFDDADLDGAWFVVAAATPEVNRRVRAAAEARRLFVNAVDDPAAATAYAGGLVRRGPVTIAISTGGTAPALAGLVREAIEALLPPGPEAARWGEAARAERLAWKAAAVPVGDRRPLLLAALNRLYGARPRAAGVAAFGADVEDGPGTGAARPGGARPARAEPAGAAAGRVVLVGAGPGDPELLTLRGQKRLAEADLVLYDALAAPALAALKALAPEARWFHVGKRAGRESIAQEAINRIMIREARRGHVVVRLKGGDPFVLGRGGEEALALAAAAVPCEVVPGVSAVTAAPALAGIPVTHRGLASSFVVVAGHSDGARRPVLASLEPGSATVVVLMGLAARADIARVLLERGWDPATPAALLFGAATPQAWCWIGRLDELGAAEIPADVAGAGVPATIVVGSVVTLARALATGLEHAA